MVEPFKPKNYNKKPPVQICRTHDESLGMIFCDWREITWPLEAKANRWDSAVQVLSAMSGATAQVLWWFEPGLFENRVMNGNEPLISTGLSWVYHVLSRFITKKTLFICQTLFSDTPKQRENEDDLSYRAWTIAAGCDLPPTDKTRSTAAAAAIASASLWQVGTPGPQNGGTVPLTVPCF